jgi:hypothetical protein
MALPPATNVRARASVPVGLLSVLAVPAAVVLSWYSETITLIDSLASAGVAFLVGAYAVLLARRGRDVVERTLGRAGGARAARIGRILGTIGICAGLTTGLAAGFYGLLVLFAR